MLVPGARVRLHGLKTKPELNLKKGVCKIFNSDNGRWTVSVDAGCVEVALKAANLELLSLPPQSGQDTSAPGAGGPPPKVAKVSAAAAGVDAASVAAAAEAASDQTGIIEGFEQLLATLNSTRGSVQDVMVYCLDNAAMHAAMIAKRLAGCLGKVGLPAEQSFARLFVVSDVLHNSGSKHGGASQLRSALQEHLPEAMERFGRQWLRRIEDQTERDHGETVVKNLLKTWDGWNMFPPLFTKGLESLIFMQISDISAKEAGLEPDERLRQKVTKWFSAFTQSELPWACCQRGLGGKGLPMAHARSRLCHYEKYWHLQAGCRVRLHSLQAAPGLNNQAATCEHWDFFAGRWKVRLESGDVKSVRPENLLLEQPTEPPATSSRRPVANASAIVNATPAAGKVARPEEEYDSIDGDPLSEDDLLELMSMEAAQAAEDVQAIQQSVASYRLECTQDKSHNARYKVDKGGKKPANRWTQVTNDGNKYIVTPMA